ncbi:uncharacterized protein TNCV_112981 [Trichonephila clavipes]|nr:uncharacterized protein TNCV_112981 [Trichonephila clavipes]
MLIAAESQIFTPVVSLSFEHHAGDRTISLGSTPILRKNTLGVPPASLPVPPTSREDFRLNATADPIVYRPSLGQGYAFVSRSDVIKESQVKRNWASIFEERVKFGLAIHQNDHQARRRFVEWAQNEIAVVPDFHKRILFSDEAHFWLNGYVNKQNCRIWSEANPQVYVETLLHPEKLTVWCALWAVESFFKSDEGHNVTVNSDRYRAMITNFFIPELNNHDVQEL